MQLRSDYPALSHGTRQHLYSDDDLYIDLKTFGNEQIVFAMNASETPAVVELSASLFESLPAEVWDLLSAEAIEVDGGYLSITLSPLSGRYILLAEGPPTIPGDYNENGVVDAADYVVWRNNLNQSVTIPNDTTPGTVSPEDYNIWRANFGLSGGGAAGPSTLMQGFVRYIGPAASAVPEPSSILLAGLGIASLVVAPRRRP